MGSEPKLGAPAPGRCSGFPRTSGGTAGSLGSCLPARDDSSRAVAELRQLVSQLQLRGRWLLAPSFRQSIALRRSGARSELDLPRDSFAGCLSSGSAAARPLPGVAPLRNCGATRNSRSALVVPAHLDGFLRAADAGVLQPAPDEVRRVSVGSSIPARSVARSSRGQKLSTSPRRTSHPSKNLRPEHSRARATHPPKQPFRVTAIVASLPF